MRRPPRNVLLLELDSSSYGRSILDGIRAYVRPRGLSWAFRFHRWHDALAPASYPPSGAISYLPSKVAGRLLRGQRMPLVNVLNAERRSRFPSVLADDFAIGAMAADYFIDRGFRHFALMNSQHQNFARGRYAGYLATLRQGRRRVHLLSTVLRGRAFRARRRGGPGDLLQAWLRLLPKPVAVFACNDTDGFNLLESCRQLGLKVPDEVAVLGVHDEPARCELAYPPLSTVQQPGADVGYQAAALLDRLMQGKRPPASTVLIRPPGVTTRQSSDVLAIDDPHLAQAIRFIREHASDPINVSDVLRHVPVPRRWLERSVREALGRSPLEEIHRAKVARACNLLADTDLRVREIARLSGFSDTQKMAIAFRQHMHVTPSQYRKQIQTGDA